MATAGLAGCAVSVPPTVPQRTASSSPTLQATPDASTAAAVSSTPTSRPATIRLVGAPNFRDLAGDGTGLALADGGHLARGVVYRSGKLSELTSTDLAALRGLGLVEIFDLRTPDVVSRAPDPKLPGVANYLINLYGVSSSPAVTAHTVAAAQARFRQLNQEFVTDPEQRRRLRGVLEQIAAADGPVLIHCTEGKDRTGWVSAMLAYLAGASDKTVLASYLESNQYRAAAMAAEYAARKKAKGKLAADIYLAQARVEPQYLQAGLTTARSRYGSIDGYLRDGVGLSDRTIEQLRAKLVSS